MRHVSRTIRILLTALGLYVAFGLFVRLFRRLFPFPVPPLMSPLLDSPVELRQPPKELIERIGLRPGLRALQVGAGPGYFTVEAARALGPEGRLSVVDVQPQVIAQAAEKVRRSGLDNAELQIASARDLPFPDGTFDLVFLVTALGAVHDKGRALRELRRVLKPSGRLSITEAMSDSDYMLMVEVVGWAQTVGFELVEQCGNALLYTLNFRSVLAPESR